MVVVAIVATQDGALVSLKSVMIKIDPEKVPAMKQAIGRMLREVIEQKPAYLMAVYSAEQAQVPKRNIVFLNVSDVTVI